MATKEPSLNQIANKLKKQTEMSNQEIREAAQNVIEEYDGLITSRKAALIFYARNEHNLELMIEEKPGLDVENVVPDMDDVVLKCTVVKVDKFTYYDGGEEKKGCDLEVKDNTGQISLMLWNEQVDEVSEEIEDKKIKIQGANSSKYKGEIQLGFYDEVKLKILD